MSNHILSIFLPFDGNFRILMSGSLQFLFCLSDECTFEDPGLCGWTNMKDENMKTINWTRNNASTPSLGTGPQFDHTYGNAAGTFRF